MYWHFINIPWENSIEPLHMMIDFVIFIELNFALIVYVPLIFLYETLKEYYRK